MKRLQITIEDESIYKCYLVMRQVAKNLRFEQGEGVELDDRSRIEGNIHIVQEDVVPEKAEFGGWGADDIIHMAKEDLQVDLPLDKANEFVNGLEYDHDPVAGLNNEMILEQLQEFVEEENG